MELRSPHNDPYSSVNHAIDELRKKGYSNTFTVVDEHYARTGDGTKYPAEKISITEIHRFANKENKTQKEMVIALEAEDGTKGTLREIYGEGSDDTVNLFLQNTDRSDEIHKNY